MKCTTKWVDGHRVLCYRYDVNKDIGFEFHLMSEVGEPYQPQMQAMANTLAMQSNCVIVTKELSVKPWYADVLEKTK